MVFIYLPFLLNKERMMKPKFTLATIIVNYKSEERTITYVKEELLSKCSIPQLIIIVNNKATGESSEKISNALDAPIIKNITECTIHSNIYIIHNLENSGFAKGNNLGVDFIKHHFSVEYLLFTNNDIRFIDSNVIDVLIDKLKMLPDVGVIGPKVVGLDGNCQSPNDYVPFWTEMVGQYWERFIPFYHIKHFDQNKAKEGFYYRLMGSFLVVKYKEFVRCGKFDPNTFLFGEEVILSERMNAIGMKCYYIPSVSILHEHGVTVEKHLNQVRGNFMMYESLSYYYLKYRGVNRFSIFIAKISTLLYSYAQFFIRKIK